ncbi:MAG: CBS domain-containing protein [Pseudomonadota bacterium]
MIGKQTRAGISTVGEIMRVSVITIDEKASLRETGEILEKHDINGAPVMDETGNVVGIVTRADVFRSILPSYIDLHEEEPYLMDSECVDYVDLIFEARIGKMQEIQVKEVMGTPPITVGANTPVVKAGSLMLRRKVKQLPVLKGTKLVGIVTLTDINRSLLSMKVG